MTQNAHVVLAAHGSRAQAANEAHRSVVARLDAEAAVPVTAGFLELAEPSIGAAIDAAVADGAGAVLVLPYFLHPGRHLTEDIPAIVAEAGRRHPGTDVRVLGSFGADPGLSALLAEQVRAALA